MPPITLCVNGHNICNICRAKLDNCPICRKRFLSTRNVGLEKLAREVKYPCTFQQFGCSAMIARDMLDEHKMNCRYGQVKCPKAESDKRANEYWSYKSSVSCDWTGNYNEVKNHLMEKHLEMCFDYGEVELRRLFCPRTKFWWFRKFVFVYNEVFYRHFFWKGGMFCLVVQYIGPPENAAKYKFKVEFINEDNTEGVTVMHLTRSFDEDLDDIFKSGNCAKLQGDVVSRLKSQDVELKFKLDILRVGH